MNGQVQALSTIMISTIVIGGVSAAYVWGGPVLTKFQDRTDLRDTEAKMNQFRKDVVDVAASESRATRTVEIDVGDGELKLNESKDSLTLVDTSVSPLYPTNWVLVEGTNLANVTSGAGKFGHANYDTESVLLARSRGNETGGIQLRAEFRNLRSGNELEKINLVREGASTVRGQVTVQITKAEESSSVRNIDGEDLSFTEQNVEVTLR